VMRYAGIAVDNQQLVAALQRRVADNERLQRELRRSREAERKRIARELHDEALQELVALTYQLATLRAGPANAVQAGLDAAQTAVQQTAAALRRLCSDLRPPELDRLGLAAALRAWFDSLTTTVPFHIQFQAEGDLAQPLPEEASLCLYRVVQEAVRNAQKHAQASRVTVRLTLSPQEVWLSVADDGVGFVLPTPVERLLETQHFGLLGMRERLNQVAGTLDIVSAPRQGTTLRVWLPLSAATT
jgi:signal transduction histidine kinase